MVYILKGVFIMRLKDISTYRDDRDYRFYMKLTYVYSDA